MAVAKGPSAPKPLPAETNGNGVHPAAAELSAAGGSTSMTLPPGVTDVRGLIAHLRELGPEYAEAFGDESRIRVAVTQRHAGLDQAIGGGDEIAFFPPVTGG